MECTEINKYEAYKKKLEGLCNAHNFVFSIKKTSYPFSLVIRPCGGMGQQMSMLEATDGGNYISPDAYIRFEFKEGAVTYRLSKEFTIEDALLTKIKNLFKNMHYCYLQYFHRNVIENKLIDVRILPEIDEADRDNDTNEDKPIVGIEDEENDPYSDKHEIVEYTDAELDEAIALVKAENKCSVSLLQRRLKIGYHKAATLVDELEKRGIVGPYQGGSPREVLAEDVPEDEEENNG